MSNYTSYEVATIVGICERRGFVRPTVYQGVYNLIDRAVEAELFPCLRQHGIRFSVYTALAGGYLTDRVTEPMAGDAQAGKELSHFDPAWRFSWFYSGRYLASAPAVAVLREVVKSHGLSTVEVAYRWLQWHSKLVPEDHGILVAPSKMAQLDDALKYRCVEPLFSRPLYLPMSPQRKRSSPGRGRPGMRGHLEDDQRSRSEAVLALTPP